jgi:hypothetical protein
MRWGDRKSEPLEQIFLNPPRFWKRASMKAAQLYQFDKALKGSDWLVYEDVREPVIEMPTAG